MTSDGRILRACGVAWRPKRASRRGMVGAAGFTLPEVLATLVLVGIVLPVAMKGISLALAASSDARAKLEATSLAENKLVELTASTTSVVQGGMMAGDFGTEWTAYRWEATSVIQDVDLSAVQVRVAWTARGQERSIILSTLVYTGVGSESTTTETQAESSGSREGP